MQFWSTHMVHLNLNGIGVPVDTAAFPGVSSITPTPKNSPELVYKNGSCHIESYSMRVCHDLNESYDSMYSKI